MKALLASNGDCQTQRLYTEGRTVQGHVLYVAAVSRKERLIAMCCAPQRPGAGSTRDVERSRCQ